VELKGIRTAGHAHKRRAQLAERITAGPDWKDDDFVWCQPNRRPIDARPDWDEWETLPDAVRIRSVRVHEPGIRPPHSCWPRESISPG
jgi:hypothetical protein